MLEWVKSLGGTVEQVQDGRDYYGAVKHLDDLHAVQSTGRGKHVIHELSKLDQVPDMDNPKMEIRYRGGVGQVVGNQECTGRVAQLRGGSWVWVKPMVTDPMPSSWSNRQLGGPLWAGRSPLIHSACFLSRCREKVIPS
jgi:hypothetical protein